MSTLTASLILLALSSHRSPGQSDWINDEGGFWFDAGNWNTISAPDSPGETAQLPNLEIPYIVLFDRSAEIGKISLDPDTQLSILSGRKLTVGWGDLTNQGLIVIHSDDKNSTASIEVEHDTVILGTGAIELHAYTNSPTNARLSVVGTNATLTIDSDQTIMGSGRVRTAGSGSSINLLGLIDANRDGREIIVSGDVNAAGGGVITGSNGGAVTMSADLIGGSIMGGVYAISGSYDGTFAFGTNGIRSGDLELVNSGMINHGSFRVVGDCTLRLQSPSALTNDGHILVRDEGLGSDAFLEATQTTTVLGSGTIELDANKHVSDAALRAIGTGTVLTIGPSQTITGHGTIEGVIPAVIQLDGTIHANEIDKTLSLSGRIDASRGGMIMGSNGGAPSIECHLIGGTISGTRVRGRSLNGVLAIGENEIPAGDAMILVGNGLTNQGHIIVNSEGIGSFTFLQADETTTLDGVGTIELNGVGNPTYAQLRVTEDDSVFTIGSGQTIIGSGQIFASGDNSSIRILGTIFADRAGDVIRIGGRIDASDGGVLMGGNAGYVDVGGLLIGGTLINFVFASGGSFDGTVALGFNGTRDGDALIVGDGFQNQGTFYIEGGTKVRLLEDAPLINNGIIVVNSNRTNTYTSIQTTFPSSVEGEGTIELRAGTDIRSAVINTGNNDAIMTIGAGQTITGKGSVEGLTNGAPMTIAGTLAPGFVATDRTSYIQTAGQLFLTPDAVLRHDIQGRGFGDQDQILGNSTINLNGTLELSLINGYVPAFGDRFTLIRIGTLNGQFGRVETPRAANRLLRILQTSNEIEAVWTCPADLNCDGLLDFFDVQLFLDIFANGELYSDYNDDSKTDFFDLQAFLLDFTSGCV